MLAESNAHELAQIAKEAGASSRPTQRRELVDSNSTWVMPLGAFMGATLSSDPETIRNTPDGRME